MARYTLMNRTSGQALGSYEADSPTKAIDAMLADAGCTDPADPAIVAVPEIEFDAPCDRCGDLGQVGGCRHCGMVPV